MRKIYRETLRLCRPVAKAHGGSVAIEHHQHGQPKMICSCRGQTRVLTIACSPGRVDEAVRANERLARRVFRDLTTGRGR